MKIEEQLKRIQIEVRDLRERINHIQLVLLPNMENKLIKLLDKKNENK